MRGLLLILLPLHVACACRGARKNCNETDTPVASQLLEETIATRLAPASRETGVPAPAGGPRAVSPSPTPRTRTPAATLSPTPRVQTQAVTPSPTPRVRTQEDASREPRNGNEATSLWDDYKPEILGGTIGAALALALAVSSLLLYLRHRRRHAAAPPMMMMHQQQASTETIRPGDEFPKTVPSYHADFDAVSIDPDTSLWVYRDTAVAYADDAAHAWTRSPHPSAIPREISFRTATRWVCVQSYTPQGPDEISLDVGCDVHVACIFGDTYCVGWNAGTGWVGNFPLSCVQPRDECADAVKKAFKSVLPRRDVGLVAYHRVVAGS